MRAMPLWQYVRMSGIVAGLALMCGTARAQAVEFIQARPPFLTKEAGPMYPKALNMDYGLPVYFECPTDAFYIIGRAMINGSPLTAGPERVAALRALAKGARAQRADALWLQPLRPGHSVEAFAIKWVK